MALADMLPTFDDAALLNLKSNAVRLAGQPGSRSEAACALLPLIEAEIADRDARTPSKPVHRTPSKAVKAS